MTDPTIFGPWHSAQEVNDAVKARLIERGETYCALVGLSKWKGVVALQELANYPQNKLPAIVVLVPGTMGQPEKQGDGSYSAVYNCIVGAVVQARTEEDTRRIADTYGAAVKLALLQARQLADDVMVLDWNGETTSAMTIAKEKRTLLICTNTFSVKLDNIVNWKMGPGKDSSFPIPPDESWPVISPEPTLTIEQSA